MSDCVERNRASVKDLVPEKTLVAQFHCQQFVRVACVTANTKLRVYSPTWALHRQFGTVTHTDRQNRYIKDDESVLEERKPPSRRLTSNEGDPEFESGFPD